MGRELRSRDKKVHGWGTYGYAATKESALTQMRVTNRTILDATGGAGVEALLRTKPEKTRRMGGALKLTIGVLETIKEEPVRIPGQRRAAVTSSKK